MQRLRAFPQHPQHVMTVTLGGRKLKYHRVWRPRLQGWYVEVYENDAPIILGRRLSVGSPLQGSLPVPLPSVIFIAGPDDYEREDLGGDLREYFIAPDELPDVDDFGDAEFITDIFEEVVP